MDVQVYVMMINNKQIAEKQHSYSMMAESLK